jgi:16S rRNA (cytidine1402-2'-O)-methyltransferase
MRQIKRRRQEGQKRRDNMAGKLTLCATPIGNLEDISYRVLREMKEADLIAAEDTRNSIKLLNHFDIHTPMTAYHDNNRFEKGRELVKMMQDGTNLVLITDAGTPGISDPGEELVKMAAEAGIPVTSIPGPAACITALTLSGLSTRRFSFEAFLPMDKKDRKTVLEELQKETRTMIVYEAPHRLKRTLGELLAYLGEDRKISLCRELTKKHETVMRTTIGEAVNYYNREEPRGEFVLVIEGRSYEDIRREKEDSWKEMSVEDHMKYYTDQGMDRKNAMKQVARDRGVGKREIYGYLNGNREG